jgi:hypothetical protein
MGKLFPLGVPVKVHAPHSWVGVHPVSKTKVRHTALVSARNPQLRGFIWNLLL